jgi:type IV secretory pathway TraG/TraD family ATPase VirD4
MEAEMYNRGFATSGSTRLSISPRDALEHTIILGPTGSGKSTVMQNLVYADMLAGRSVLLLDPKAELVNDVTACVPKGREDDVVILDLTSPTPVGFNPFAFSYGNPALIADAILAVFQNIFSENWGIRSQDVLSAALLTLAQTEGASLLWLPTLLTDETFRRKVTAGVKDKIGLAPYWEGYEEMKESERRAEIAPVLNKIRQFLLRPALRNVLGQSHPKFDLMDLFTKRKIVLVPLNKGTVGAESARLLGSLIVGMVWTMALSRANIPAEKRHMVSLYIDELQDYIALPTDLSDALAQARGLGVAMTLAHQYRAQLPPDIRAGVDANARNKIVFGILADAKEMAAIAPELEAVDFMSLPRYSVYTSFHVNGRSTGWISGKTLPPTPPTRSIAELRALSMTRYGKPAEEVEAEYIALLESTKNTAPLNPLVVAGGEIGRVKS